MSQIGLLPNPTLISPLPPFLSSYRTGRRSRSLLSGASFRRMRKKRDFKACVINGTMNLRWPAFDEKLVQGKKEMDLPVELCVTRDLAPAVTLREGVNKIKEAMAKLKLDPPCSQSGVMRFQVRVPPSIKALNWLCSQLHLLEVFPHFFVSFGNEKDEVEFSSLNGLHAVSGFGASIYFDGSTHAPVAKNILRYLSVDSPLIRAYGFIGTNCSKEASMLNSENIPFCIFIPQIELNEYEDSSVLASTLIWDDYQLHKIQDAIQSIELHLNQLVCVALPSNNFLSEKRLHDTYGHLNIPPVEDAQMVFVDAEHLARRDFQTNIFELVFPLSWETFKIISTTIFGSRLSKFSAKTCRSGGLSSSLHEFSNINALWASLIVEECVRLGLTYFCIAPGSRSSPLAISAATHPLTTCISSYDERSLAFHAVGYAKASSIPAVVITSSGTAVSNLLPAVVEASQDFVPLLLLTADRPPELQDNGANQAINQIDHFGKFVRFFSGLPPPSDEVLARMVLTTIDTAVQYATQEPCGPVHINCPFREPLADHPSDWTLNCLQGLDHWISNFKPFTTYINIQNFAAISENPHQLDEVLHALRKAERGLLLLGSINAEDEIWAAALVAEHLSWPVVPDILSGLRLRKLLSSLPSVKDHLLFVDHLDHALLSDLVKKWAKPDIILQLGSRITSKRIAQFVESCSPSAYIFVDKHPCRHDPLHLVSQRIQSTINVFAESLLKIQFPRTKTNWSSFLHAIDTTVSRELALQICLGDSLTEPYVAHVIAETLQKDGVLFVGNSMVIRDVDMYGQGWVKPVSGRAMSDQKLQCQSITVVGNRGASGIDGLLSSASGFAAGCKKRVLCLVGDVSFLHDTNGLAILNERIQRKPMTMIVINNHGGGIFSFLPIAERTQSDILKKYFYTSHDISIAKLCAAHSIRSLCVRTKMELHHALSESQHSNTDCVIEVESCISENSDFHSLLKDTAAQAATQALNTLLLTHDGASVSTIQKMEYSQYRFQLSAPLTTTPAKSEVNDLQKEGFIISVILTDGTKGFGEVAPIKIHEEDLKDAEEQLRFLLHTIVGSELNPLFRLCNGSFSSWFWKALGIMPSSLFPSVRCGIEMALLHALASKQASGSSSSPHRHASLFGETASPMNSVGDYTKGRSSHVPICALVDCSGTLKEVSQVVYQLLEEGFTTIKFKVGRRPDPTEDGAIIQEIRSEFGYDINIRVDANRSWSYEEALVFGQCVKNCNLQYIEEPVQFEDDIIKFCEETNLPVALDETIDNIREDLLHNLNKFVHPRIVAVVIKPSVVGGFENAALIAKWAQKHEKLAIISSAFESSLSLSAYVQFAGYLEHQRALLCRTRRIDCFTPSAHGFGTYKWLKEDITTKPLKMYAHFNGGSLGVSHEDAVEMLLDFKIDEKVIQRSYSGEQLKSRPLLYNYKDYSCSIRLLETRMSVKHIVTVFLHGFLGTCEEWIPIMKALSSQTNCVSIDLPGHGQSYMKLKKEKRDKESRISVESVGDFLHSLLCDITDGRIILVGYSMGARIALYMSLKYKDKIEGTVLISGSPGLKDKSLRMTRAAEDEAKARFLSANGLQLFLDNWYRSKLWDSLRAHPRFEQIKASREKHGDVCAVSQALSDLSIGRQMSLWEDLRNCTRPLLLIVGENDKKFKEIACQMRNEILNQETEYPSANKELCTMVEVPECGHAVHLEDPLAVINAVSKFLKRVSIEQFS